MHYKNGREAKENDPVIYRPDYPNAKVVAGTIHSLAADPNCTTCNGQISTAIPGGFLTTCVTVGQCYHAEDALAAITPVILTPAQPA